jgi:hypothetical protein
MCSIHKISLTRAQSVGEIKRVVRLELVISGSCFAQLRNRARQKSRSVEEVAIFLLEQIANDDLFDAVMDTEDA